MAVIINEFEVVAEEPPVDASSGTPEASRPAAPSAVEIERIVRYLEDRALRAWAH